MASTQRTHLPAGSGGDSGSTPLGSHPPGPHLPSAEAATLVGVWHLVDAVYRYGVTGAGGRPEAVSYLGESPHGMLIYAADGSMSVQLMGSDRRNFATGDRLGGTDTEVRSAFETWHSYFGRYSINEAAREVTHHIEGCSYPNFVGTDQKRFYTLGVDYAARSGGGSDDGAQRAALLTLALTTTPLAMRGRDAVGVLTWRRPAPGAAAHGM